MSSIRSNLKSGIIFTAISKYSNVFVSIIIGAVLARLLTPEEFGVVVIVSVFISFFNLLSNFGLGPAVVQFKELSENDIQSIFLFSIIFGTLLSSIFFISSPLIADYYNDSRLINLSRWMSLSILFNTWQIIPNALMLKSLKFKYIGIVNVGVHIISGGIAICLAYYGFSYYALVINSIVTGLLLFVAYYFLAPIKLVFRLDFVPIKKIAKFSTFQFFFNFINYFSRNADNLLIGKYFSTEALGFYDKAYRLMMMPVQNLTHVITPVLHPVLSNYQNEDNTIYEAYKKVVRILSTIGFPLSIFLYFSANEIITIVFGSQWETSIPIFRLLALTVGIQMVLSSTGSIFQSKNRTDLMFYAGLIGSTLLILGICYGIFYEKELIAVGHGLIIAFVINIIQALYLLIKIALKHSFGNFLIVFFFPLLSATCLAFSLWGLELVFTSNNLIISLIVKSSFSLLIFTIITAISSQNRNIISSFISKKK